jgi:hypothetical protein
VSQELIASKSELEVASATLNKNFKLLKKAHKSIKWELIRLKENHEELCVSYMIVLATSNSPIVIDVDACATMLSVIKHLSLRRTKG